MKRLIAIGDIHGEIHKLNSLINKIHPKKTDTLVFLGDYIDRGYDSKEVVSALLKLSKNTNCKFLMGNHEYYLLRMLEDDDFAKDFFFENGGERTLDSYGSIDNLLKTHGEFYKNLKYYYLENDFLFVHAGIHPNKSLDEQDYIDMLIIRDNFINHKHKLSQKVIFGHTPFKKPYIEDDKIGINTGSGLKEGYLTAYICNENNFVFSKD